MEDFTSTELTIKVEETNDEIILLWIGKSREREPAKVLMPYFDGIYQELNGRKLKMNFRELETMNSSTVPPVVKFVKNLEDSGVATEILYDKNIEWQKASFKALETVTVRFKNILISGD